MTWPTVPCDSTPEIVIITVIAFIVGVMATAVAVAWSLIDWEIGIRAEAYKEGYEDGRGEDFIEGRVSVKRDQSYEG